MSSHGTALSSTLRNNRSRAWGKALKWRLQKWRHLKLQNCPKQQQGSMECVNSIGVIYTCNICAYYVHECWRWFRLLRVQFSKCSETVLVQCGHVEKFHAASPSKPQLNSFIIYRKIHTVFAGGSLSFSNQSHTIFLHCGLKTKQNVFLASIHWVKDFAWKDIGDPLKNLFQHLIFPCVGLPCHSKWIPNNIIDFFSFETVLSMFS